MSLKELLQTKLDTDRVGDDCIADKEAELNSCIKDLDELKNKVQAASIATFEGMVKSWETISEQATIVIAASATLVANGNYEISKIDGRKRRW